MRNRIEKRLRHYWHEVYYFFGSKLADEIAMTCKKATEKMDLPDDQKNISDHFRVWLHTSLCQACSNYKSLTLALRNAIRNLVKNKGYSPQKIEKLNQDLVKKFVKVD